MPRHIKAKVPPPTAPQVKGAILYARVSSVEQEEEGWSTDAQLRKLREYCNRRDIPILHEFEEAASAKRGSDRNAFTAMVEYVTAHPGIQVVVEKVDRLLRNYKDWVLIDELKPVIHFVNEGVVLDDLCHSSNRLLIDIRMVLAKNYSENLSEEIRKGMSEKAKQGHYPTHAPIGYKNSRPELGGKSILVSDARRAHLVQRLFAAYATGNHSIATLAALARTIGLTTKRGNPVQSRTIHDMLRNPVYAGRFYWNDQLFEGIHEPIVDEATWQDVQDVLDGRGRNKRGFGSIPFAYRNLVRCKCGLIMTAEIKKGRYTYYHCTGRKEDCHRPFIREEAITDEFRKLLVTMTFPPALEDWIKHALRDDHDERMAYQKRQEERLEAEAHEARKRLERLYSDFCEQLISRDIYSTLKDQAEEQLRQARRGIAAVERAQRAAYNAGVELVDLVQTALARFDQGHPNDRNELLKRLCSNCVWRDGELFVELRKPYDLILKASQIEHAEGQAVGANAEGNELWWR